MLSTRNIVNVATKMLDVLSFLRTWASDPATVGAIAPSSTVLAELIASEITAMSAPIIELGPGTGVFTRALLARGVREEDLTLVECRSDFVTLLRQDFRKARVLRMDAARLRKDRLFDNAPVGAIVSGLPLLNMSSKSIMAILGGAFDYMRPGGAFYQFTYGPSCPVSRPFLDRLSLRATVLGRAFLNIPPAAVYRITRGITPARAVLA